MIDRSAKIYVAGHRGMVGSAIVRALETEGYRNIILRTRSELDLRRQEDVERFFREERPEYVFLAAARVGGILANSSYKAEFIYDNLAIALNVIEAAHRSDVRKLLNLGSSCIYPRLAPQPIREEYLLTGELEPTNDAYAIAKIAAIKLCRFYNEQYGTDYISLMPTNLYGPNDNFNLESAHVLPALLRKFSLAKLLRGGDLAAVAADLRRWPIGFGLDRTIDYRNHASIVELLARIGITADHVLLWGSGSPRREFLHVDDLADASLHLMKNFSHREIGELVNVGTGEDREIGEIAEMVRDAAGFEGEILHDRSKPDGTPRKLLDVGRLKGLGWQAAIPLEQGLATTLEWYHRQVSSEAAVERGA
jgi:GDP-L-fucose synthase